MGAVERERDEIPPGTLYMLVLKTLSALGPMHGYGIAMHIQRTSEGVLQVEEGSLYPALHRMEEADWLRGRWIHKPNGRRARIYELSPAGKKQLAAEEARWNHVTAAVNRVLRMA